MLNEKGRLQSVPHSDEICKDMHDRVPDRTTGSSMPSRLTCAKYVVLPVVLLLTLLVRCVL